MELKIKRRYKMKFCAIEELYNIELMVEVIYGEGRGGSFMFWLSSQ